MFGLDLYEKTGRLKVKIGLDRFQLKITFLIKKQIEYLKAEGVYKNSCFYDYLYDFIDKIKFHRELEFGIQ